MEKGVTYKGDNIGKCGSYNTQNELQNACSSDSTCVGYTMNKNRKEGRKQAVADKKGFYPWCLQGASGEKLQKIESRYYTKVEIPGKIALMF